MGNSSIKIERENAADRYTYIGDIFNIGEKYVKNAILNQLPLELANLHKDGYIHIHDLEGYGLTYNCLTFDLCKFFPYMRYIEQTDISKIIGLFDFLKEFLTKLGNEQSGGMAFANFDNEIADILKKLEINLDELNESVLRAAIHSFIIWCNNSHERMGKTSYYITLNLGLADTAYSQKVCEIILDEYEHSGILIYKPNIVFKVKKDINYFPDDPNYFLFQKSLRVTTIKMIPTYVLCDAEHNINVAPEKLSVMGCRTRVVANKYGEPGSVGRGNIAYITINLPRIAFEIDINDNNKIASFCSRWEYIAGKVSKILEKRYETLVKSKRLSDFNMNSLYKLWNTKYNGDSLHEIFKHGTLSIGFIGLSEAIEIMTGNKFETDEDAHRSALQIVSFMRHFIDTLCEKTQFNYSLLATSGEMISGKFLDYDIKNGFTHRVLDKGFYTNSFHVDVSSGITPFKKIDLEAPFHILCNGGCITYIEFVEAPINNEIALEEIIKYSLEKNIHYLGFNYNLDVCNNCNQKGVFDKCSNCGSTSITRIRRVSGYLEVLDYFTQGKINEVKNRKGNEQIL